MFTEFFRLKERCGVQIRPVKGRAAGSSLEVAEVRFISERGL